MCLVLLHNRTAAKRNASSRSFSSSARSPLPLWRPRRPPVPRHLYTSPVTDALLTVLVWDFRLLRWAPSARHASPHRFRTWGHWKPDDASLTGDRRCFKPRVISERFLPFFLLKSYRSINIQEVTLRRWRNTWRKLKLERFCILKTALCFLHGQQ